MTRCSSAWSVARREQACGEDDREREGPREASKGGDIMSISTSDLNIDEMWCAHDRVEEGWPGDGGE